jgi:hypothetical protein
MSNGRGGPRATKMRQWPDGGDSRNKRFCAHCGGPDETRDHNPSKVFLDNPLPDNLPVASSCQSCNAGFSDDEEYVACLLECVVVGHVEPERMERASIGRSIAANPRLQRELLAAQTEQEGQKLWSPNASRVRRIALKLARGLVDFELNEPRLDEPEHVYIAPLLLLTEDSRREFEGEPGGFALWPEVGSRAFNRLCGDHADSYNNGWIFIQQDRFRYRVTQEDGMCVRIVLREYLAIDVAWD